MSDFKKNANEIEERLRLAIIGDLELSALKISKDASLAQLWAVVETVEVQSNFDKCCNAAQWAFEMLVKNSIRNFKEIPYQETDLPYGYKLGSHWEEFKLQVQRAMDAMPFEIYRGLDTTPFEIYVDMVEATINSNIKALCWQTQAFIAKFKFDENFDIHEETYHRIVEIAGWEDLERDPEEERKANAPSEETYATDPSDDELEAMINAQMDADAAQEQTLEAYADSQTEEDAEAARRKAIEDALRQELGLDDGETTEPRKADDKRPSAPQQPAPPEQPQHTRPRRSNQETKLTAHEGMLLGTWMQTRPNLIKGLTKRGTLIQYLKTTSQEMLRAEDNLRNRGVPEQRIQEEIDTNYIHLPDA